MPWKTITSVFSSTVPGGKGECRMHGLSSARQSSMKLVDRGPLSRRRLIINAADVMPWISAGAATHTNGNSEIVQRKVTTLPTPSIQEADMILAMAASTRRYSPALNKYA